MGDMRARMSARGGAGGSHSRIDPPVRVRHRGCGVCDDECHPNRRCHHRSRDSWCGSDRRGGVLSDRRGSGRRTAHTARSGCRRQGASMERLDRAPGRGSTSAVTPRTTRAPRSAPTRSTSSMGTGRATIEELIEADDADGHQPAVRRDVAAMLHRFVQAARLLGSVAVGPPAFVAAPDEPLWGEPHDVRFDFDATARGAQWIDDAAAKARSTLHSVGAEAGVVGHFDWRTENLGFVPGQALVRLDSSWVYMSLHRLRRSGLATTGRARSVDEFRECLEVLHVRGSTVDAR